MTVLLSVIDTDRIASFTAVMDVDASNFRFGSLADLR
jgi:hypothetical protein